MPNKTHRVRVVINADFDAASIREETLNDEEHLVVPIVMLVEGVHTPGNVGRGELALAEEFGRYDGLDWNGRPIVLGHPIINGTAVSANSPSIVEAEHFGMLFNSRIEDSKLKSEAWINLERVKELDRGDIQNRLEAMQEGQGVEVSTGFYTFADEVQGRYNTESFEAIWRDIAPDHLAILPEGAVGACSIEDGCGAPRLNSAGKECKCGGKCGTCAPTSLIERKEKPAVFARQQVSNQGESFDDRREAIAAGLLSTLTGEDSYYYVVAIYDDYVVYATWQGLFQRSYVIAANGSITIGSDVTAVRPSTQFVPVVVNSPEDPIMTHEEAIAAIIANERTRFTEEDRPFLEGLNAEQLEKLEPLEVQEPEPEPTPKVDPEPDVDPVNADVDPAPKVEEPQETTVEQFLQAAPAEVQEVLNEAMCARNKERDELSGAIRANSKNQYSEAELAEKTTGELRKLASLAATSDYRGAGGVNNQTKTVQEAIDNSAPPRVFQ